MLNDSVENKEYEDNAAMVYLQKFRGHSQETMRASLRVLCGGVPETFDWSAVTYKQAVAVRARLMAKYKPASVNLFLVALRGVLTEAFLLDQFSSDELTKIKTLKRVNGQAVLAGHYVEAAGLTGHLRPLLRRELRHGLVPLPLARGELGAEVGDGGVAVQALHLGAEVGDGSAEVCNSRARIVQLALQAKRVHRFGPAVPIHRAPALSADACFALMHHSSPFAVRAKGHSQMGQRWSAAVTWTPGQT